MRNATSFNESLVALAKWTKPRGGLVGDLSHLVSWSVADTQQAGEGRRRRLPLATFFTLRILAMLYPRRPV
jgi:hypothetical protein